MYVISYLQKVVSVYIGYYHVRYFVLTEGGKCICRISAGTLLILRSISRVKKYTCYDIVFAKRSNQLFSFTTHRVCNKSGAKRGARTVHPFGVPEFIPSLV